MDDFFRKRAVIFPVADLGLFRFLRSGGRPLFFIRRRSGHGKHVAAIVERIVRMPLYLDPFYLVILAQLIQRADQLRIFKRSVLALPTVFFPGIDLALRKRIYDVGAVRINLHVAFFFQ